MGFRWDMLENLEDDENFFKRRRIDKEQYKQEILDQTFLKTQLAGPSSIKPKGDLKKSRKKPIIKTGFIVIILALFAIIAGQFLPWMYLKYDGVTNCAEYFVNRNFEIWGCDIEDVSPEVINLFSSPTSNQGRYSGSFIGISINDFTNIPKTLFYIFLIVIIISLVFSIYILIDRSKKFDLDNKSMVYSIYATSCILLCIIVLSFSLKFIASYLMLYLNQANIQSIGINDARIVYIVPFILIILTSIIIKSFLTVMKLNYRDIDKRIEKENCERRFQTYKFGDTSYD
jgi:hypothetical protein